MDERGLNRLEVAKRAGLNQTAIYDIISGKSGNPRVETLYRIATLGLGVNLRELVEVETPTSSHGLAQDIAEIIDMVPSELQGKFTSHILDLARLLVPAGDGDALAGREIS